MAHSSLTGIDPVPLEPDGRSAQRLGPSDSSDSGSDTADGGVADDGTNSDRHRTGERAGVESDVLDEAPADVSPDAVVRNPDAAPGSDSGLNDSEARDLAAEQARSTEA